MDEDLKAYLQGMEERTVALVQGLEGRTVALVQGMEERTVALIAGEIGLLHTQIQQSEARLGARLDSIDSRLKLQAGLIQSGARAMARFSEFAESSEERWVALVGRVEALERKIEGGAGKG